MFLLGDIGMAEAKAIEKNSKTNEKEKQKVVELKTDKVAQQTESTTTEEVNKPSRQTRLSNAEFFSRDFLGESIKDSLIKEIELKSRTAISLYNLTYDRMDSYLHRPKEISTLIIARDANDQIQKQIENRLTELNNYILKRYKKVKALYDAATAIETLSLNSSNKLTIEAKFSTGAANQYLNLILMIDEACYMAGYLEKIGELDIKQESNLTSELYRKTIEISRILIVFIGRTVRSVRNELRKQ